MTVPLLEYFPLVDVGALISGEEESTTPTSITQEELIGIRQNVRDVLGKKLLNSNSPERNLLAAIAVTGLYDITGDNDDHRAISLAWLYSDDPLPPGAIWVFQELELPWVVNFLRDKFRSEHRKLNKEIEKVRIYYGRKWKTEGR